MARIGISSPFKSRISGIGDIISVVVWRVGTGGATTIYSSGGARIDTSRPLFKLRVIGNGTGVLFLSLVTQIYAFAPLMVFVINGFRSFAYTTYTIFVGVRRVAVYAL